MSRVLCVLVLAWFLPATALAADSEGKLWIEASCRTETSSLFARREYLALVGVSLPWDRWFWSGLGSNMAQGPERSGTRAEAGSAAGEAPTKPKPASESDAAPAPQATEGAETTQGAEGSRDPDVPPVPPARQEPSAVKQDPAPTEPVLTTRLLRETLRRALEVHGFGSGDEQLSALASRARWSGVLPEMRLRAARTTDESMRLAPTVTDPTRYSQDGGAGVVLEARLSWELSKLLFAVPELTLERLRRTEAQRRASLVNDVLKVLFAWQRALLLARDEQAFDEQRKLAELEALEAELRLHVLTGGWFEGHRAERFARAVATPKK